MDLINGNGLMGQNSISRAEEDRISLLPDSLLHLILSFLNMKWVARTSVLSKRWSHIWISIPTLDFQVPDSGNPQVPDSDDAIKFMDFVDRTLFLHDFSNIKKFSLSWPRSPNQLNASKINSWISAVLRHNVEEISLLLDHQLVPNSIPLSLFTCTSLVTLELSVNPDIRLPGYITFPRLKRLKLFDVRFSDERLKEQLFSSCPLLEDLVLEECTFYMRNFCISIPTLKHLKLDNFIDQADCLRDCSLRIDAPNLVSFTYLSGVPREFILSTFPALVEAEVEFLVDIDYCYFGRWEQRIAHDALISRFLQALAHVKQLSISDGTLQVLMDADCNLPTFDNVKQLTLTDDVDRDDLLFSLLGKTPNLESLMFEGLIFPYSSDDEEEDHGYESDDSDTKYYDLEFDEVESPDTVGCLCLRLKSVCFEHFVGTPREMRWVKLILKNAKLLETMIITYGTNTATCFPKSKSKEELIAEIPSLPRTSSSCLFKFSSF